MITSSLKAGCLARLEELATGREDDGHRGLLADLKAAPGQVSLETLLREVDMLAGVTALHLPVDLFADCSERLVEGWRARASRSYPSDLAATSQPVRLTLLAALWDLVREAKAKQQAYQARVRTVLRSSYTHNYRRMLPALLDALRYRPKARTRAPAAAPGPRHAWRSTRSCHRPRCST